MDWVALAGLIPEIINITVDIIHEVHGKVDDARWKALGPEIEALVKKALSGEDFSHEEVLKYVPKEFELRLLQLRKKKERIEAGLPVVED